MASNFSEEQLNELLQQSQANGSTKVEGIEQDRLKQCFKNQEFRDLLADYMREISDPKNKEEYEKYIAESEVNIEFEATKPVSAVLSFIANCDVAKDTP